MKHRILFIIALTPLLVSCSQSAVQDRHVPIPTDAQTLRMKEYKSEFMKASLQIPIQWQVMESLTLIEFRDENSFITLEKTSTNVDDIDEFISDLDTRVSSKEIQNYQKMKVGDFDVVTREELKPNVKDWEKKYYIYTPNRVYTLVTSSPDSYDELDAVARSFQYFGD